MCMWVRINRRQSEEMTYYITHFQYLGLRMHKYHKLLLLSSLVSLPENYLRRWLVASLARPRITLSVRVEDLAG